jgi:hypothetical protein
MIGIKTDGDAALAALAGFPHRLAPRLARVMAILGTTLEDRVRDNLTGAVLRQRSGQLEAGLALDIGTTADGITSALGVTGVPYAAYQEYGFHGTESVRAHLRVIKEAFGRAIAPRATAVRAYSRQVDYPAHSFLRSALQRIAPDVVTEIEEAIAGAVSS